MKYILLQKEKDYRIFKLDWDAFHKWDIGAYGTVEALLLATTDPEVRQYNLIVTRYRWINEGWKISVYSSLQYLMKKHFVDLL